eukprot:786139-Pelagomonas_calceolata.AAC.5
MLFALVVQRGWWVLQRHEQHLHGGKLGEGRMAMRHLQQGDAHGPDVSCVVITGGQGCRGMGMREKMILFIGTVCRNWKQATGPDVLYGWMQTQDNLV